jgi:CheY-like chemotaxis protein
MFVAPVDYDGQTAFLGTFFDITARKRMQRELTRAMKEAQTASLAKTEFLASMSHELRTPMNAIVGMGELLAETRLSSEQEKYLQVFRSASENLINLIGDILDITKVESGRLELESHPFRLSDVLERAVDTLALKAHGKGIEFACLTDRNVPEWVVGDAVRLRQIIINLGGNAIKFTHEGEVVIRIKLVEREVSEGRLPLAVEVSDTGVGIPADKLETVFERFTQADSSTTREYGGVGLGLHITKRLAELMDGTVWAVSKQGEGSVFRAEVVLGQDTRRSGMVPPQPLTGVRVLVLDNHWPSLEAAVGMVRRLGGEAYGQTDPDHALEALPGDFDLLVVDQGLPDTDGVEFVARARKRGWSGGTVLLTTTDQGRETMTRAREHDIRHTAAKPVKTQEFLDACLGALDMVGEVGLQAEGQAAATPSSTILLVEDSEYNRLVVEAYLKDVASRIVSARDGGEALERFRERRFDLVLMDIQMPVMDGYEAIRRMRALEAETGAERTPVIALTAFALSEDADKCLAAGADAYLAKPVRKGEFLDQVARFLINVVLPAAGDEEGENGQDTGPLEVAVDPALKSIVPGFLDFVRKAVAEVTEAMERGDFERAEVLGHRMKGEGAAFGFQPVTEYGARIQRAGQEQSAAELSVAVAALAAYLDRVVVT